jgi:hypothetical protein
VGKGEKELSPRESRFVEALASGATLGDCAMAAGVSYRSAVRWRKLPAIKQAVADLMKEEFAHARAILASGAARAARELVALTCDRDASAAQISACKAVLSLVSDFTELSEIRDILEDDCGE